MSQGDTNKVKAEAQRLVADIERLVRLELVESLTVISSRIIIAAVMFVLGLCSFIFLCLGVVHALASATGSVIVSYCIVGGLVIVIMVVFCVLSSRIVVNPLLRLLSKALIGKATMTEMFAPAAKGAEDIHSLAESLARDLNDYDEEGGDQ